MKKMLRYGLKGMAVVLLVLFICSAPYASVTDATVMKEGLMSLSVQDTEIQSVLRAISIKRNLNIVSSEDVKGKISVNVHDLPLEDVLEAVITINGFSYHKKDRIIFVTKSAEGSGSFLRGFETGIFKLKYANIEDIEKIMAKLLSKSARITIYKPEKTLIVEDDPGNLARAEKVIRALDVPPRQVLIETKIMEIRLNDDTALGIDWNTTFTGLVNSSGNVLTKGFAGRSDVAAKGFFFDVVNGDFNLFLEALQTKTEVHTLSSPRLLALDSKEAKIIIGGKLGYNVTTAVDGTVLQSVEFLETGTQLVLTPHIVDDSRVIMDIHPEISDGTIINGLPTETTTEVTTSLMAPDGGTIFIGGLIRDRKEDIEDKVPGMGDIPVLGALFSRTNNITVRTEVVVLITPHIITAVNREVLEQENKKVDETEKYLQGERSLTELVPGIE